MRSSVRAFAAFGAILSCTILVGCAGTSGPSTSTTPSKTSLAENQCLSVPLEETKIMDDTTLYAKDPSGRAALIHMSTACLYDHSDAVSLTFRGTSEICGPLDVEIAGSATSHIPSSCLISSITPLTKDEAKVYEAKKVY